MKHDSPQMVFIGPLQQDYIIGPLKDIYFAQPGGAAMYAAAGARVWVDEPLAIVSRIGEDFPQAWLKQLQSIDIMCEAVHVVEGTAATRAFYEYRSDGEVNQREPRLACARAGVEVPKELLAYTPPGADEEVGDRFAPLAIRPEDLPGVYRQARAAYLAPAHVVTHLTLPAPLRSSGTTTIALSPSARYLLPTSLHLLRPLLRGISVFLLNERMARGLFREFNARPGGHRATACGLWVSVGRGSRGHRGSDPLSNRRSIVPVHPRLSRRAAQSCRCRGRLRGRILGGLAPYVQSPPGRTLRQRIGIAMRRGAGSLVRPFANEGIGRSEVGMAEGESRMSPRQAERRSFSP